MLNDAREAAGNEVEALHTGASPSVLAIKKKKNMRAHLFTYFLLEDFALFIMNNSLKLNRKLEIFI